MSARAAGVVPLGEDVAARLRMQLALAHVAPPLPPAPPPPPVVVRTAPRDCAVTTCDDCDETMSPEEAVRRGDQVRCAGCAGS